MDKLGCDFCFKAGVVCFGALCEAIMLIRYRTAGEECTWIAPPSGIGVDRVDPLTLTISCMQRYASDVSMPRVARRCGCGVHILHMPIIDQY